MKEGNFKKKLKKILSNKRIFYIGSYFSLIRGIPDLIVIYKGVPIVIELKRDNNKITPLQMDNLTKARECGAPAFIVTLKGSLVEYADKVVPVNQFCEEFPDNLLEVFNKTKEETKKK